MISNNGIVELHGSRVELDNVKSILANPQGVGYCPLAESYISDTKVKQEFDKIKKEIGYEY